MRIVAGEWRGRTLIAPSGTETRPTADRVRQALFDILMHASWAGRPLIEGATVLDVFAGTGALGLEALSRGAAKAVFVERSRPALAALRANIAACRAEDRCAVLPIGALTVPEGEKADIVFLDPPYGQDLVNRGAGTSARDRAGRARKPDRRGDRPRRAAADVEPLAERTHGAARLTVWRESLAIG